MMLEDIGNYLKEKGVGEPGIDIFYGSFPEKPDDCIAVFEYQGLPQNQIAGTETPGMQIVCRTQTDYKKAHETLKAINNLLKEIGFEEGENSEGVNINDTLYFRIYPTLSGIIPLGQDENGRVRIAQNYYVIKEDK